MPAPAPLALDLPIATTPVCIFDFETTGLSPRIGSRVVEVAVIRCEPGAAPELVLETLIDPEQPVHCTRIHGIDDDMVLGAPRFVDVAAPMLDAMKGAVVAAYNASFDRQFLEAELAAGFRWSSSRAPVPMLCLMRARPALGVGARAPLESACAVHGIPVGAGHRCGEDAMAAAQLWEVLRRVAIQRGAKQFRHLVQPRSAGEDALSVPLLQDHPVPRLRATPALKPRSVFEPAPEVTPEADFANARRRYWHAITEFLADEQLSLEEIGEAKNLQEKLGLSRDDVRAAHLAYASQRFAEFAEDGKITRVEAGLIAEVFRNLELLGWRPGDVS